MTRTSSLIGAGVYDSDDKKVGTVGQIYYDSDDQSPSWVTVRTGLFGASETFAPLVNARIDSTEIRLAYARDVVKDAPRIADDGDLSPDDESALYVYYGLDAPVQTRTAPALYDQFADGSDVDDATSVSGAPVERHDVSASGTDDAMTRSEERLRVGTERVEVGRARLRKYVVTEEVTRTVPVAHDEITVTREPITDADAATAATALREEEHEIVLTGERVVTTTETVPVERVRLGTRTVDADEVVTADVSHEEIELVHTDTDRPV